jgi:hypothetical protein
MDGGNAYNSTFDWDAHIDAIMDSLVSSEGWWVDLPPNNGSGNPTDVWDMLISLFSEANGNSVNFEIVAQKTGGLRFDNLTTKEYFSFSNQQLLASASNPRTLSFTMNPGLYLTTLILNDGTTLSFHFATKSKISNTLEMKDFVSINLFPNPIQGDQYYLNVTSEISTTIQYEVINLQGNRLHSDRLQVRANSQTNPLIVFPVPIPSGMLIHRFVFSDGSSKTILSTK